MEPMRVLLFAVGLSACVCSWGNAAYAFFRSGNDLLQTCQNQSTYLICLGYVEGVVDDWDEYRTANRKATCIPVGVAAKQVADIVVNYLNAHPEVRHWEAPLLIVLAVSQAWSCK